MTSLSINRQNRSIAVLLHYEWFLPIFLAYLGKDYKVDFLEEKTGIKEGKALFTIELAKTAALLGYGIHFYSKRLLFDESYMDLDFYKQHGVMDVEQSKRLLQESRSAGVRAEERTLTLEELLTQVTQNSIPIVILDWNVVLGKKELGYRGHFVPIVGYDDAYVYIHQHGLNQPQAFMPIEKRLFDEARKARGTDEDIIIISLKN